MEREDCVLKRGSRTNAAEMQRYNIALLGQASSWNFQGKRRRGRPRNTWRRDPLADTNRMGITWNKLEAKAQDTELWRSLVDRSIGGLLLMAYTPDWGDRLK